MKVCSFVQVNIVDSILNLKTYPTSNFHWFAVNYCSVICDMKITPYRNPQAKAGSALAITYPQELMSTFARKYIYFPMSQNSYFVKSILKWLRQEMKICNKIQNTCWLDRRDSTGELGTSKQIPLGSSKSELSCTFCRQKCLPAIVKVYPNSFQHCY